MSEHKNPKPNSIAELFKFKSRNRADGKIISEYMAELRRLTQYCDYGTVLNHMLRDRLVCGVNRSQIQQKLLGEGSSLTLEKALSFAISVEAAIIINKQSSTTLTKIQRVTGKCTESKFTTESHIISKSYTNNRGNRYSASTGLINHDTFIKSFRQCK